MSTLYIFDMGGVVTTTASIDAQLESVLHMSRDDFYRYCGCTGGSESFGTPAAKIAYDPLSMDLLTMCSNGVIDSKEFWRLFSERSGCAVQTDWWHWLFHPVRNEDTVRLIEALRKAGNRVVCGTNTIDSHYKNHCERGDYAFFDQTYSSFLMGVSKPDPMFWRIILTAEDVRPEDAVFIDDKKVNCDAAASLGIRAVQFTDAKSVAAELGVAL